MTKKKLLLVLIYHANENSKNKHQKWVSCENAMQAEIKDNMKDMISE